MNYTLETMVMAVLAFAALLGVAFAQDSLFAFHMTVAFIVLLAIRTFIEEETLRTGLQGYDDYAARVRYKLIPMVW